MNFVRQDVSISVDGLLTAIGERDIWGLDTFWKDFPIPVFREVDTIYLRFPDKGAFIQGYGDVLSCHDQPALDLLPEAKPVIDALVSHVGGGKLGRVMINKVGPGAKILPHSDGQELYYARYHVVLASNESVYFRCGDEEAKMRVGETWWFDNSKEHEVVNNGKVPRIHLVADIRHE